MGHLGGHVGHLGGHVDLATNGHTSAELADIKRKMLKSFWANAGPKRAKPMSLKLKWRLGMGAHAAVILPSYRLIL